MAPIVVSTDTASACYARDQVPDQIISNVGLDAAPRAFHEPFVDFEAAGLPAATPKCGVTR